MLCGALGIGPAQLMGLPRGRVRSMGAASRPYSINAAVWLAFVAVNGFWLGCLVCYRPLATVALFMRLRVAVDTTAQHVLRGARIT